MNTSKGRWRRWTNEEDQYVRRMHGRLLSAEIARVLGRGTGAVRMRARLLGVASRYPVWTPVQDHILRNHYATASIPLLATLVGLGERSVWYRMQLLKLKKTRLWKAKDDNYLHRWYGRKTKRTIAEHLKRKPDAVYKRAKALGLSLPRKSLWTPEENRFLRSNYRVKGVVYVATSLGRSVNAVRLHAITTEAAEKRKRREGL